MCNVNMPFVVLDSTPSRDIGALVGWSSAASRALAGAIVGEVTAK